jgi:pimeloyl-ACP methyl ester carboxylesterase
MPTVDADGTTIAYDVAGEGPPVLLLHGFPDTAALWRHQVGPLVDAGFRVITPDLRGYGRSSKPEDPGAYAIPFLAGDALAVLDDAGAERAHVVGHDWGAALAWSIGAFVPDRVDHLVTVSVGYPGSFLRTYAQREKSWYMLFFQFEGIAEQWLSDDGWANFKAWSRHPDADAVTAQLEVDGSLTPALNYYRANVAPATWAGAPPGLPRIAANTMGVWSTNDMALTEAQMTDSAESVDGTWRYERIEGPGHWIPLEAPDALTSLLLDFLPR